MLFQGLRTVSYKVTDIAQAKDWYSRALGFGPYYDQPYYVGFSVIQNPHFKAD
jgi:catechol 2,3-dioxygenase-like lactoylglutathione lyase family enzyme